MKKELSIFEQMGGTYTEIDGISYPNLVLNTVCKGVQFFRAGKECFCREVRDYLDELSGEKLSNAICRTAFRRGIKAKGSRSQ